MRAGGVPSNTLRWRVEAARRFGGTLVRPLYVPTGGVGEHPPSEAQVMATLLQGWGVAADDILMDETADDTLSSVRACAALLRGQGHQGPVYAATSAYHLPRCLTLLRLAGVRARACPPPDRPAAASHVKRWCWRLRELPALPWDVLMLLVGGK